MVFPRGQRQGKFPAGRRCRLPNVSLRIVWIACADVHASDTSPGAIGNRSLQLRIGQITLCETKTRKDCGKKKEKYCCRRKAFHVSSTPSRAGALKVGPIPVFHGCGLRASPVSWLGGFISASFPQRRLASVSLQCPALCCFRLTVARRRRLALRPPAISAAHRLPVHEACGYCRGRCRPLCVARSRASETRHATRSKTLRGFV